MRKGDYAAAARYLVVPRTLAGRGPELAARMRAVIEQWVIIDLDAVSPLSTGNPNDGLPAGVDRMGTLPPKSGATTPIYIVRRQDKSGTWWALSRETVLQIDEWYELGRKNGALGGKLVGAGAGGFLLFYAEDRVRLREAMTRAGLEELRFKFDFEGTKVLVA